MSIICCTGWIAMDKRSHKLSQTQKTVIFALGGVVVFILVFCAALIVGRYGISFKDFFRMLANPDAYPMERSIVVNLRLPRTIIAALTGIALSLSGLLYQETFQNKLVSPDLLGVSSGSGVGAALAILLGLSSALISLFAFLFGIITVLLTMFISKVFRNRTSTILILAGIIVGGCMSAILSFIKYLADAETTLASITFWLMGSFENSQMSDVWFLLPIVGACTILTLIFSWRINIVALGREEAQTRGINYAVYRAAIIAVATLLTASSVAFAGTISWIGLVVPHIVRLLVGRNTRKTIPLCVIFGANFMVIADMLSRCFTAAEIPLSAVTGFFGTIIFVVILFVRRKTISERD